MTPLNSMQRYGLRMMAGGLAVFILAPMLFPVHKSILLGAWAVGAAGAITYVAGPIPGVVTWLRSLIDEGEKK